MAKSIVSRILDIDIRWVNLVVIIGLVLPLLVPITLPLVVNQSTIQFKKYIDAVPSGGLIIWQNSVSLSLYGDVEAPDLTTWKYILQRPVKIIIVSFSADGPSSQKNIMAWPGADPNDYGKKYGIDWVWIGYIPGDEPAVAAFTKNLKVSGTDYSGTPLDQLDMMKNLHDANDVSLVIASQASLDVASWTIRQWYSSYSRNIVFVHFSSDMPSLMPYYPVMLKAYLSGSGGAAELDVLTGQFGIGSKLVQSVSLVLLMSIVFIVVTNIAEWISHTHKIEVKA